MTTTGYAEWYWAQHPELDPFQASLSIYTITSSADSGPGTLRDALSQPNRLVTLSSPLTVPLSSDIVTGSNNIVIDGKGLLTVKNRAVKLEGVSSIVRGVYFKDALASTDTDGLTFRGRSGQPAQVLLVENCVIDRAGDGGLDIIWSRGHDVYFTVRNNVFRRINKTCLVDAGDLNEGGLYYGSFFNNVWEDCFQRMPMARNGHIHIDGDSYIRYGEPAGGGGGAKANDGCSMLVENINAVPRTLGEKAWNGVTVTKPRIEAVGPHLSEPTGNVRAVNCPMQYVNERNQHLVPDPPYRTTEEPCGLTHQEAEEVLAQLGSLAADIESKL